MSQYSVVVYKVDTGEIVDSGYTSVADDAKQAMLDARLAPWGADTHAVLTEYGTAAGHYVGTLGGQPTVMDRPPLVVQVDRTEIDAGGIDEAVLTGLPDPCEIIIDDPDPTVETTVAEVTGGGFIFAADSPGTYTVEVRRFPFLPFKVEIVAL